MVSVEVPEPPVTGDGTNEQLAPAGKFEHESETAPANPATEVMVTVEVVDPPAVTAAGAEAKIVKSAVCTSRTTVALWESDPEVPVTCTL